MPRFKSISKSPQYTRLFVGDKMHISNMVKELGKDDKKFENPAAAIRYYVHVGIAAETATSDLRNSLDNTIIKASQKDAVRFELKPLANVIEQLVNRTKETEEETARLFQDLALRTTQIENKIDAGFESLSRQMQKLLMNGEYSLRTLIVLRCVMYIFLLGLQTGKIEPGKENIQRWGQIIKVAHDRANRLSNDEIKMITNGLIESQKIREMATEIIKEVIVQPDVIQT